MINPLFALPCEPAIENLVEACWDVVEAPEFHRTQLRFRNDALSLQLGIDPDSLSRLEIEAAYSAFFAALATRVAGQGLPEEVAALEPFVDCAA